MHHFLKPLFPILLSPHNIHIWRVCLPVSEDEQDFHWQNLIVPEQAQAMRYVFEEDRLRSIISRGVLRYLLGQYLQINPRDVVLEATKHGKLFLPEYHALNLKFNVSHAQRCIAYAFTRDYDIGIDVEYPKKDIDFLGIAKRFFSQTEFLSLQSLNELEKPIGFYQCWTRKEAFVKAVGEGLAYDLADFEVSLLPNQPATLLSLQKSVEKAKTWQLVSFTPMPEYYGAFITEQPIKNICYYDWSGVLPTIDFKNKG